MVFANGKEVWPQLVDSVKSSHFMWYGLVCNCIYAAVATSFALNTTLSDTMLFMKIRKYILSLLMIYLVANIVCVYIYIGKFVMSAVITQLLTSDN